MHSWAGLGRVSRHRNILKVGGFSVFILVVKWVIIQPQQAQSQGRAQELAETGLPDHTRL